MTTGLVKTQMFTKQKRILATWCFITTSDLKSYAKGSISSGSVTAAIESLARSLSCAEKSIEWQNKFIHPHVNADICGLLFIYNHDGGYDKEFRTFLEGIKPKTFGIPKGSKLVVLGPDDIYWLNNVRYEIVHMRGKDELPSPERCRFYYPHLIRSKNVQVEQARAATLEMLTAPWIVLSYHNPRKNEQKEFVIFYRRKGDSVQEFLYLIDYLMHYQVLVDPTRVRIRTLDAALLAKPSYEKAVGQYLDECELSPEIKTSLDSIEYGAMTQVVTRFSEINIGME
jgi:hypothetical protein